VAREPHYLNEYAAELSKIGRAAFQVKYRGNILLGEGMVAKLSERPLAWQRRTLASIPSSDVSTVTAVVGRVWRVRKDPGGGQRGPNITLGQSADNDIVVPEYTVSTKHCEFIFDPAGMSILDRNSLNGVKLNGVLIEPGASCRIKSGYALTLGRLSMVFLRSAKFVDRVEEQAKLL